MASFSFFQNYPHSLLDPILFPTLNSSIIDTNIFTTEDTSLNPFLDEYNIDKTGSSGFKKQAHTTKTATTGSSSCDQLSQEPSTTAKNGKLRRRRKIRNVSTSKEGVEGIKSKTQRNYSPRNVKEKKGSKEEPPQDFIHVRARRGQATDSHSLAERVRREKISERMKILQKLVPGCDKVTGKALMLDEIINYVQTLQNQVEFLSMKLASISPVYDFGSDLDGFILRSEEEVDRSGFNTNSFCSFP